MSSSSKSAPQQHKQPSRKGKKAWRKNVDIGEIQDGLDTLREQIILGGPVAEKPSEELFALDTTGSEDIKRKYKVQKSLKVDEILAKRSAIPAVDSRKRQHSALTDGVLESTSKRQKKDWVSKKEVQRLKNSLNTTSRLDTDKLDNETSGFDLWAAEAPITVQGDKPTEYVPKPRAKVAPSTLKRAPIPMTADGRPVRAVQQPNAGTSYNPSFEEWDDLLNQEGAKEVEAERLRLADVQAAAEKEARVQALAAMPEANPADDESAWEGFETENEDSEALKKKRPQRKTPAQRNKVKRRKEAERLAKHEKKMGDKAKQTEEMIMTMIKRSQEDELDLKPSSDTSDQEDGDDRVLRRRKRGNAVIPEKALEVVLPDELQDSLRRLKPEGNLLNDRFRNLLVNGKLEARKVIVQPKKRKVKMTEKWSYKDFSIQV